MSNADTLERAKTDKKARAEFAKAAALLQQLARQHPRLRYVHSNLGACLFHCGDYVEAAQALRTAIA